MCYLRPRCCVSSKIACCALGKSTLAKLILRILDFDKGNLLVNGIDIRRYDPVEYHRHITTVFQGFSKFNSTVKENVGIGYVQKMESYAAIDKAISLAGAETIVESLPNGLRTKLDTSGFGSTLPPFSNNMGSSKTSRIHHGLSGGEVSLVSSSSQKQSPGSLLGVIVATNSHLARIHASRSTRSRLAPLR